VTGQHFGGSAGTNDVDGGPVRLISPVIPIEAPDVEVSYARWFYWGGQGTEDLLIVDVSRDGGTSWVTVETVATTGAWVTHSFRLSDFPSVTGDQLRVRFSTEDSPSDSLTEAAIDEFRVRAVYCSITPGDANHDGAVDLADARQMSTCWAGPARQSSADGCGTFDFDHDYHVDLADYQSYQIAFNPH